MSQRHDFTLIIILHAALVLLSHACLFSLYDCITGSSSPCTSGEAACLILQVLLFAVVFDSASAKTNHGCMLTTNVCNAWRL